MRAVAERLVLRGTAAADGHVVALFVLMTVSRGQHHAATQPNRAAAVFHRIFDQCDPERPICSIALSAALSKASSRPAGQSWTWLKNIARTSGSSVRGI
jgi:hypothetical protein